MIASDKQQRVYNEFETTNKNIIIEAVAGSGKTTTLLHLLSMAGKTLFLSFNNSIQKEIESKIIANNLTNAKAQTLHSLGYETIRTVFPRVKVNNNKGWDIINITNKMFKRAFSERGIDWKDANKIMMSVREMWEISRIYLTRDVIQILKHADMMDKLMKKPTIGYKEDKKTDIVFLTELFNSFVRVADSYYDKQPLEIDFTDMIYIPVIKNIPIPIECDNVFIDECQDLNLMQHKLVDMLISKPCIKKWVAVGDRNQSIYGFVGAFPKSFDLYEAKENTISLPLDINYRCPTKVVEHANLVYNNLISFKKEEGVFENFGRNKKLFLEMCKGVITNNEDGIIICRNNAPLVEAYFMLLNENIPCYIKGDDIAETVNKYLKPYARLTISQAKRELDKDYETLYNELPHAEKYKAGIFQQHIDTIHCFIKGLNYSPFDKVQDLLSDIEKIKAEKDGAIILCSIHKSKGLEADNIVLLNEELIPSKFSMSPESLVQEQNLRYVARTRAKKAYYKFDLEL